MPEESSRNRYIFLVLKGLVMGAADVVPGVSGGTIAFITGIYSELVDSLRSFDIKAIRLLIGGKLSLFWQKINGNFLLAIFSGILVSVFSLARLLQFLLLNFPVLVWSFFFGLIIASAVVVIRKIDKWEISRVIALITGVLAMYLITRFSPAVTTDAWWFVFISGALAICAMILPGISGAFILLILGKYQYIIAAVGSFDIPVLLVFGLGVITGLLSFANFLSWLLKRYQEVTVSVLAGFIIGSLNKIWPWKENLTSITGDDGSVIPLLQRNILPGDYLAASGNDPQVLFAIGMAIAGMALVILLDNLVSEVK